ERVQETELDLDVEEAAHLRVLGRVQERELPALALARNQLAAHRRALDQAQRVDREVEYAPQVAQVETPRLVRELERDLELGAVHILGGDVGQVPAAEQRKEGRQNRAAAVEALFLLERHVIGEALMQLAGAPHIRHLAERLRTAARDSDLGRGDLV